MAGVKSWVESCSTWRRDWDWEGEKSTSRWSIWFLAFLCREFAVWRTAKLSHRFPRLPVFIFHYFCFFFAKLLKMCAVNLHTELVLFSLLFAALRCLVLGWCLLSIPRSAIRASASRKRPKKCCWTVIIYYAKEGRRRERERENEMCRMHPKSK